MTREEAIKSFDPNGVGQLGSLFGLPFSPENAQVVIIPVPWEVTVSYGSGTASGPEHILEASPQLDLHLPGIKDAWQLGVSMLPIPENIKSLSTDLRTRTGSYIKRLEEGDSMEVASQNGILTEVEAACKQMIEWVYTQAQEIIKQGKIPAVLGGDHSTPLGLIKCLANKYSDFGILQIDAHADLRIAYEGFKYSHASIMYNAIQLPQVTKLAQVGIRDICEQEVSVADNNADRVKIFYDKDLKAAEFGGANWHQVCTKIVDELPQHVYISFDIDGLDPTLCPNTGTPVPGGLSFQQALYLLDMIHQSGKRVIGFDLCEVAPGENEWNGNVGARVLYHLVAVTGLSNSLIQKIN